MDGTGEAEPPLTPRRQARARREAPARGRGRVTPASLALVAGLTLAGLASVLEPALTPGVCWGVALLVLLCR